MLFRTIQIGWFGQLFLTKKLTPLKLRSVNLNVSPVEMVVFHSDIRILKKGLLPIGMFFDCLSPFG